MAMADPDSSQTIRRSQRDKKQVERYASDPSGKRKRADSDTDDDNTNDLEDLVPASDDDDGGEDFRAPAKPKQKSASAKAAQGDAPSPKKSRGTQGAKSGAPKTTTRRPRKGKNTEDAYDAAKVAKDTKIAGDNALFNAIMNPSAALQSTTEDFLESLSQTPGPALAELINLVLRACGCNDSVDADQVVDYDGVVDALDTFTESLKKDNSPVYPLTSKLPAFKKFRKSLSEFLDRLVRSSADYESLYSSDLMATLQTWVVAMSSSQIRSFRHTATVVALEVETALCTVAAAVEKEAEVIGRQREGERKRRGANSKTAGGREKELEGKANEARHRRTTLAEFLKEFVDGVFVHRYRDLDPNIRAECVRSIGLWFKRYPGHFLDGAYLRYVGWVLSDANTHVRLEAVNALSGVYDQDEYIGSLNHFTERFKPRLIEMATGDTELGVRVAVIRVLGAIDSQGLLEDEEREKLCLLIFDEEAKVRKAVSGFVHGVWQDSVEERLVGRKAAANDKARAGVKALGMLIVKWGRALDKTAILDTAGGAGDEESTDQGEGSSHAEHRHEAASLAALGQKGRIALAVDALWDEVDPVHDWETLLDVLLLDHSAQEATSGRRGKGKKPSQETPVDEAWRLAEIEESVLLECFVAALRHAQAEVSSAKKGEDEIVVSDITRALIKGLPRLFIKYQTDSNRIANVLQIPPLMNLDLYLEMRMVPSYVALWDDVTKQFLSHSSLNVLSQSVVTLRHFLSTTSLSNTNSTKIVELDEELSTMLHDAVAGRDEIEVASFSEDEVASLSALCARLAVLAGMRDMTAWTEEDESGKQSRAWDIISAVIDRGRLGYKEEASMIEQAMNYLALHVIWKARGLSLEAEHSAEKQHALESLREQRDSLVEKFIEYAVGTQSNTADTVKRSAFQNLLNLHILFRSPRSDHGGDEELSDSLDLELEDEVQYRCAGFVQAEIERYAEELGEEGDADADGNDSDGGSGSGSDNDDEPTAKASKSKKVGKTGTHASKLASRTKLEEEYVFMGVISTFLRAIRAGAINIRHCAVLLAHHGRIGVAFDACNKVAVDALREEGMYHDNPAMIATVVVQAVRESFSMLLDGIVKTETHTVALAKLLSSCFLIRGAQLAVVRKLDTKVVVQIQTTLLTWIGKRLAHYELNSNKVARRAAVTFFRVLIPLLATVESRNAMAIKAHLDQILAQAKIEPAATSKLWEPLRAYEKRLGAIMLKEKGRKKGAKTNGVHEEIGFTSEEEHAGGESGGEIADEPIQPAPRPRPKPRHTKKAADVPQPDADTDMPVDDGGVFEQTDGDGDVRDPEATTPQARPKPRAVYKSASKSPTKSPNKPPGTPAHKMNGTSTPQTSPRKRRHDQDSEAEGEQSSRVPDSELSREPSPDDEMKIRRKRVRH